MDRSVQLSGVEMTAEFAGEIVPPISTEVANGLLSTMDIGTQTSLPTSSSTSSESQAAILRMQEAAAALGDISSRQT